MWATILAPLQEPARRKAADLASTSSWLTMPSLVWHSLLKLSGAG